MSKSLIRNQNNMSEWSSTKRTSSSSSSSSSSHSLFSLLYSWKSAHFALNNNHFLTHLSNIHYKIKVSWVHSDSIENIYVVSNSEILCKMQYVHYWRPNCDCEIQTSNKNTVAWLTVMKYLCHKWPRICSTCRKHFPVLSSFMTYHRFCN